MKISKKIILLLAIMVTIIYIYIYYGDQSKTRT